MTPYCTKCAGRHWVTECPEKAIDTLTKSNKKKVWVKPRITRWVRDVTNNVTNEPVSNIVTNISVTNSVTNRMKGWREKNSERYNAYMREYMKRYRSRKEGV